MSVFQAGVQYDDFNGTVAADRADEIAMRDFLIEEGIANDSERINAIAAMAALVLAGAAAFAPVVFGGAFTRRSRRSG